MPRWLPHQRLSAEIGTPTTSASLTALRKRSSFRPRRRCQHATLNTTVAAVVRPTMMHVPVGPEPEPVGEQIPDARQLGLSVDDIGSDRTLHPRVRDDDEERRQPGSEREEPDRRQVDALREPIPAEDPEPEEGRLEHERREALDRERRAEHVADVLRVDRPVHPELELLDEPRRDADREVDQHQRPEEAGQPQPRLVAGAVPARVHDRDKRREPERERDEEEVVERRHRELEPSEIDRRHRNDHQAKPVPTRTP